MDRGIVWLGTQCFLKELAGIEVVMACVQHAGLQPETLHVRWLLLPGTLHDFNRTLAIFEDEKGLHRPIICLEHLWKDGNGSPENVKAFP